MSKYCKKCGAELLETNLIAKVKTDSLAEKNNIKQGDFIVAIDDQPVKTKSDIDATVKEKKACKLNIKHDGETRTINVENPVEFLKDIEFETEKTCHKCGANQNASKAPFIVLLICIAVVVTVGVIVAIVLNKKGSQPNEEKIEKVVESESEGLQKNIDSEDIKVFSDEEVDILKEAIENYKKQNPGSVSTEPRVWKPEESSDMKYKEKLLRQLNELYDEVNKEDDDNPFSEVNTTNPVDKGPAGNSGLGANKTKSDRPQEDTVVCIGFDYGSYLSNNDIRIKSFLNGSKEIETSEEFEFDEIALAVDDMIKKLPEDKRAKGVFAVIGYTDTSFRNGKSDLGEESRAFNTELSLKRANSIKKILVEQKNIDEKRIIVDGRGFEDLIHIKGSKTEDHSKSRRVEVYCYEK